MIGDVAKLELKTGNFIAAHEGHHEKAVAGLVPTVQLLNIIATLQYHIEKFTVARPFIPQ